MRLIDVSPASGDSITAAVLRGLPAAVDPFALSRNEYPFPPLPGVRSALMHCIHAANRYPEFLPGRLRRLIAGHVGVEDESVLLGAGASGVAAQVMTAVTRPGDRIVLSRPTFDGYPIFARMAGLTPVSIPLDAHGHQDLAAMTRAARDARVVVLCRPHNPTGTVDPIAAVERFLADLPGDTTVLLDEAYIEFVAPGQGGDAPALVRRFPNVVVLRTFSKAYGLAGLRIGYGLATPKLAAALWAMQVPFAMSDSTVVAVAASYDAEMPLRHRIQRITTERRYLRGRLRAMGVDTTDSQANFVYLPGRGRLWRAAFPGAGPQVRHYPDGGARITVGGRESTRAVLAAVRKVA